MEALSWVVPSLVAGCAAGVAAVVDVREYRVPNAITIPLFFLGILYHTLLGGMAGFQTSLLGAAFGFASLVLAYAIGILGAGDVKLVTAVGAWLGLPATIGVVVVAALGMVLYSFLATLLRGVRSGRKPWKVLRENLNLWIFRLHVAGRHFMPDERVEFVVAERDPKCHRYHLVPFAAMVAGGCVIVLVGRLLRLF